MTIELIGIITIVCGLLILRLGPDFGIYALMIATLLGAAAAVKLPMLGGANILPAHALLPFYALAVAKLPRGVDNAIRSLAYPGPGFWFTAFVVYGVVSALFLPRLFAGTIDVFSIARDVTGRGGGTYMTSLSPGSGNITQSVYLVGNLVIFMAVMAHAASGALSTVVRAVVAAAAMNLMFAVADLATYAASIPEAMDFIRNANYGLLTESDISGYKRIVGSFTEASAFGGITLVYFAFCFELWLRGVYPRVCGLVAALLLLAALASTSSSTYVGLGIYATVVLLRCAAGLITGRTTLRATAVAFVVPAGAVLVVLTLALIPSVWTSLSDLVDRTLLNKLQTQSGIERALWNEHALRVFYESFGLGAGVGSVRASSFLVAVLANTGLIGLLFLGAMLISLACFVVRGASDGRADGYIAAGGWACFALLLSASLTASSVDLGLLFFINAAIVTAAARLSARSGRECLYDQKAAALLGRGRDDVQSSPMRISSWNVRPMQLGTDVYKGADIWTR